MKRFMYTSLALCLAVPYMSAYAISNLLKLKGREDMPTIQEFLFPEFEDEME